MISENKWNECVKKLYAALELNYKPVGIKLIKDKNGFDRATGIELKVPIQFCQMVRSAAKGNIIKAQAKDFSCKSGSRALGIEQSDPLNERGENWARLGLYHSGDLSRNIRENLSYSKIEQYGVQVGAIEYFDSCPDVIQIISNPYNCMRIMQGYAHFFGEPKSISILGNQAVCHECTARPYVLKDINVSLMCIGTRHRAGWKDEDMSVGIPKEQFEKVVEGIWNTVNIMESNKKKEIIEEKARKSGLEINIRYNYNYYMDCGGKTGNQNNGS